MYSLSALFLLLPLYFSHVLAPFGVIIGENYSFERQKMYFFLGLLFLAYLEKFLSGDEKILSIFKKYRYVLTALFLLPIASGIIFGWGSEDATWLFGSYEKHHGYLLYAGTIFFSVLMAASMRGELRRYLSLSIISALVVALVAIGEYLGGWGDIYGREELISLYPGRSISTLGNPNYLAGFLLPFIPLIIFYWKGISFAKYKSSTLLVLGSIFLIMLAIATAKSYIGIFLGITALSWYAIRSILRRYPRGISVAIFLISISLLLFLGWVYIDHEKFLSLQSRFVLMYESFKIMLDHPISLLIGFGPDSIISLFSGTRSDTIRAFFPDSVLIDSTHNILLDIVFQYGILPIAFLILLIRKYVSQITPSFVIAGGLWILFFMLNVVVVSHILLFVLINTLYVRNTQDKSHP